MVEVFNFIKVIIMAVFFIIILALLAPTISDSVDNWKAQPWANDQPLLTFFIGGIGFWLFLGLVIGILGAIVYGVQVWGNNG